MMSSQGYHQSPGMSVTVRPMSEAERQAVRAVPKPARFNAIGIALMSMLMAVMVNFVDDPVALIMPVFFALMSLGLAVQARRSSTAVAGALAKGTVTEVRAVPANRGSSGWDFGVFSVARSKQIGAAFVDGVPASLGIVPEAKRLLSVNGVALRKTVEVRAPAGFENTLANYMAAPQPARRAPEVPSDDLPPPPEGWGRKFCPKCGESVSGDYLFCRKCGFKLG